MGIRVPATTANLGPGYDCLGIALQIYNHVTVERGGELQTHPMVAAVAEKFFAAASAAPFSFSWKITGDVPRSRGMGSSVTVRLGLLHGLNELSGKPLSADALFHICAELEGLVEALGGAKDWRSETPSAELTQRIREAVVSKLPAAPPHFRTVMMESDLGQQNASRSTIFFLALVVIAIGALVLASMVLRSKSDTDRQALKGKPVYEAAWNDNSPDAVKQWQADPEYVDGRPVATRIQLPMKFCLGRDGGCKERVQPLKLLRHAETDLALSSQPLGEAVALDSPLQPSAISADGQPLSTGN